jgi:hypothetical protein
MNGGV